MLRAVAFVLATLMAATPIHTSTSQESQPAGKEKTWLAICIIVGTAGAVTGVILVARKCRPRYYCMRDGENPPNYFVGTATDKECQINGWERVNGPYDSAEDVPPCNSNTPTNVTQQASAPLRIEVQASADLKNWEKVHEEVCDPDVFGYALTNKATLFYRFKVSSP